VEEVEGEVIEL